MSLLVMQMINGVRKSSSGVRGHDGEELLLIYWRSGGNIYHVLTVPFKQNALYSCEHLRKLDDSLSPSPSVSNSSIMLRSSSSLMFSPSSRATRLRFLRLILPDSSSSNSLKAFRISSFGSRSRIRSVTEQTNSLGGVKS